MKCYELPGNSRLKRRKKKENISKNTRKYTKIFNLSQEGQKDFLSLKELGRKKKKQLQMTKLISLNAKNE